jgi:hypothetical protein
LQIILNYFLNQIEHNFDKEPCQQRYNARSEKKIKTEYGILFITVQCFGECILGAIDEKPAQ